MLSARQGLLAALRLVTVFLATGEAPPLRAFQEGPTGGPEPSGTLPLKIPDEFAYRSGGAPSARIEGVPGYGTKWAVIIGIDKYPPGGPYKSLANAASDARAVLATLRDEFGFSTSEQGTAIGGSVDDRKIRSTLEAWPPRDRVGPHDLVVFYYAGHGGLQGELIGSNGRAVPRQVIVSWLMGMPCLHRLLILDNCYAGNVFRPDGDAAGDAVGAGPAPPARPKAEAGADAGPTRKEDVPYDVFTDYLRAPAIFALTGARLEVAADNSVFAEALLDSLHDRADSARIDQVFTFRELAARVEVKVRNRTAGRQVPAWERLEPGTGDIVFIPSYLVPTPSELDLRRRHAASMAAAHSALAEGNVPTVQALLDALRPAGDQQDLRTFDWFHLWRKTHQGSDRLPGHGSAVLDIARLPGRAAFATIFRDNTLRVSDETTLTIRAIRYGDATIDKASITAGGDAWASVDQNGEIVVRHAQSGRARPPLKLPERRVDLPAICSAFALSPDGKRAYWAGSYQRIGQPYGPGFGPHRVVVWDLSTGAARADDRFHNTPIGVIRFRFSEDGSRLALLLGATISQGTLPPNEVSVVDPGPALAERARLKGPGPDFQILDLAFNRSGTELYASVPLANSNDIYRWSVGAAGPPRRLFGDRAYLNRIALSHDEALLAAAGGDGLVRLWDLKSNAPIGKFAEHRGPVSAVAFLGDGKRLVSGGEDGLVVLWDIDRLRRPDELTVWQVPAQGPAPVDAWFAGDESTLVLHKPRGFFLRDGRATQTSESIEVWNINDQGRRRLWREDLGPHPPAQLTPTPPWHSRDGRLLVLADDDKNGIFSLKDPISGKELGKVAGPAPPAGPLLPAPYLKAVAVAPDSSAFALADSSGLVRVWSASRPSPPSEFQTGLSDVGSLAFLPKAETLLVGGVGTDGKAPSLGLVQFWKVSGAGRFEQVGTAAFHDDPVEQIEVGPEGKVAAILTRPAINALARPLRPPLLRIGLIDTETRKIRGEQSWVGLGQFGPVAKLQFSPDGRVLVFQKTLFDPFQKRQRASLAALDTRTGATRAALDDLQGPWSFAFADWRAEPGSPGSGAAVLVLSERGLRFFDPFTLTRSGNLGGPEWLASPFAISPSGRVLAFARGGTVGLLRAADPAETDGQTRRIRSWVFNKDPEVCSYGLGAMGLAGFSPQQSLGILYQVLRNKHEIVRRSGLLRLQWDGTRTDSAAEWAVRRLGSKDPDERVIAADTLGRMGIAEDFVLSGLHANLGNPDTRVAAHAYAAARTLRPDDMEAIRLFILGFKDGNLAGDALTRNMILDAINSRHWVASGHLDELAIPLATGLKKIQADFPSVYFIGALEGMGSEAAPAAGILLDLLKGGEPRNRLPIAVALAYIAPDDPRVAGAILPVITPSLDGNDQMQWQSSALALAFLGAKARPALQSLKRVAGQPPFPATYCQFAVRLIETPEAGRKATLSAILADPRSNLQSAAIAYLARSPSLRSELRPILEALSGNPGLNPYLKDPLGRLLKAPAAGVANLRPF